MSVVILSCCFASFLYFVERNLLLWNPIGGNRFSVYFFFSLGSCLLIHHYRLTKLSRVAKMLMHFPSVPYWNLPLVYHMYKLAGNETRVTERFDEMVTKYGAGEKMVYSWYLGVPHLLIAEPKVAEKILMSNVHTEKGIGYTWVFELIKKGLITSSGEKWRHHRKLFNPAFSRGLFERFIDVFDQEAKELLQCLQEKAIMEPFFVNIYPNILNASVNMAFESSLGMNLRSLLKDREAANSLETFNNSSHIKMFKPYLYVIPFVYRLMGKKKAENNAIELFFRLSGMAIQQKRNTMNNNENTDKSQDKQTSNRRKMQPFLDILLKDEGGVSQDEYNQHLLTIVGAASDTTATSINVTLFMLAANPTHQEKCHAEIDDVLGDDPDRRLTAADLVKMKYLEMCWKEALRLFPSIPVIARKTAQDQPLDDGRVIPQGVDCLIDIYHIHRDAQLFPNPAVFDPLRFLPEIASKRPSSHYIPFSMGMRNCIGLNYAHLESMVVLIRILSRFTMHTDLKAEDIRMVFGVPGKPDRELLMKIIPRARL